MEFKVTMPAGSWFGIGFGKSMVNENIILWQASGTNSRATSLYSTKEDQPTVKNTSQCLTTSFAANSTHVVFTTKRLLDTGVTDEYVIAKVNFYDSFNISTEFKGKHELCLRQ